MEEILDTENSNNLQSIVEDELDNSPLLAEVLGNALDKCKMFHVKLCLLYTSDAADDHNSV